MPASPRVARRPLLPRAWSVVAPLLGALLLGAPVAIAQGDPAVAEPIAEPIAEQPAPDVAAKEGPDDAELAQLRALEAKLSTGTSLTDAEAAAPLTLLSSGKSARVRALAAAVAAWLDPKVAAPALAASATDADARVRAMALASLVSLARRLDEPERQVALNAALVALDDPSDEVACGAIELVQAVAPSAAVDAARVRAETASDVRYACLAGPGGLPVRTVDVPPLPGDVGSDEPPLSDGQTPPPQTPKAEVVAPSDGTWLLVAIGASAGAVAGGALPGAIVVSRDVLTYTPDRTRIVREEVSFGSQLVGAAIGSGVGAASMWGLAQLSPPTVTHAASAALATGAGMLFGGGLQLSLNLQDAAGVFALSGATAGGLAIGGALATLTDLTFHDHSLALGLAGAGGLASLLAVFAAVPVGFDQIGAAYRTDFAVGIAALGASTLGLVGLGLGIVVEVPARRTVAAVAGGLLVAGLTGGVAFAAIPGSLDIKSRIACGIGLGGQVVGTALGVLLLPDSLFGATPAPGTALHLNLDAGADSDRAARLVHVGLPTLMPLLSPANGSAGGIAASLVSATF